MVRLAQSPKTPAALTATFLNRPVALPSSASASYTRSNTPLRGWENDEIRPSFQSAGIVFNSNHGLGAMIFVPRPEATLVFEPPTLISFATSSTVAALPM